MPATLVVGRLVVTTAAQAGGAPMVDPCRTLHSEGSWAAGGYAIRPPWRHRSSKPGRAVVLGLIGESAPAPYQLLLRLRRARHELRCLDCRVTWRSWWRRLRGDPRGMAPMGERIATDGEE